MAWRVRVFRGSEEGGVALPFLDEEAVREHFCTSKEGKSAQKFILNGLRDLYLEGARFFHRPLTLLRPTFPLSRRTRSKDRPRICSSDPIVAPACVPSFVDSVARSPTSARASIRARSAAESSRRSGLPPPDRRPSCVDRAAPSACVPCERSRQRKRRDRTSFRRRSRRTGLRCPRRRAVVVN